MPRLVAGALIIGLAYSLILTIESYSRNFMANMTMGDWYKPTLQIASFVIFGGIFGIGIKGCSILLKKYKKQKDKIND